LIWRIIAVCIASMIAGCGGSGSGEVSGSNGLQLVSTGATAQNPSSPDQAEATQNPLSPDQAEIEATYQYVGVVNTSITPNFLYPWGEFLHLSQNITEQSLLDYFEERLDTCFIEKRYQAAVNLYRPVITDIPENHDLFRGDVRAIDSKNSYATAIKTPVSAGEITIYSGGNKLPILTPGPTIDFNTGGLQYDSIATITDLEVSGNEISLDIGGENFPSFSGIVSPVLSEHWLTNLSAGDGSVGTYTWEAEVGDNPLAYVDLTISNHDIEISCRLRNDGHFEITESTLDELNAASSLAYTHFLQGEFTSSSLWLYQMGLHKNDDALLVTNTRVQ